MQAGKRIRIGLIGCGWIGQHHGANILANQNAELVGVYNPTQEHAKAFLQRTGSAAVLHKDCDELLRRSDVDAVVCSVPAKLCREYVPMAWPIQQRGSLSYAVPPAR